MRDAAKAKARAAAYYQKNKEAIKARVKKWSTANLEKVSGYQKAWQEAHPGLAVVRSKAWATQNPERAARNLYNKELARFGLTIEDFDNLYIKQGGVCAICKEACSLHKRLSVDHDHVTLKVRGLLCHRCNMAIGLFRDRDDCMVAAAEYVVNARKPADKA